MPEIRYSKDHEYIRVEGSDGVVGISDYAQQQLGDVVFAETPPVGKALKKNCVIVADRPAFVVNRLLTRFLGEITRTVDEGTPFDVAEHAADAPPAGKRRGRARARERDRQGGLREIRRDRAAGGAGRACNLSGAAKEALGADRRDDAHFA